MPTQAQPIYTLEEYFERELKAERRHEFIDGKIVPVTYTSKDHGRLVHNLDRMIGTCLTGTDREAYAGDRMLYVPACNKVFYPDLIILPVETETWNYQGKMEADLYPTVLIEVLSDSTKENDRTEKWRCYKMIDSLRQYVLIAQKYPYVETYFRRENDREWLYTFFDDLAQEVTIGGCPVPLSTLYERVNLRGEAAGEA